MIFKKSFLKKCLLLKKGFLEPPLIFDIFKTIKTKELKCNKN